MGLQKTLKNNAVNNYNNAQNTLNNQQGYNDQYTGNAGYTNSLAQGLKGAAVTAGQAGSLAQKSARMNGMSKGAASALGAEQAANAYSNNFANQQNTALNSGLNAVNANQALANQYSNLAGQQYSNYATQRQQNIDLAGHILGAVGNTAGSIGNLIPGV